MLSRRVVSRLWAAVSVLVVASLVMTGVGQTPAMSWTGPVRDSTSPISLVRLTTEHLATPLGLDAARPRLGWINDSTARGSQQTAYEISVAPSRDQLLSGDGLVWKTGKVRSAQSFDVRYAGSALASSTRYFWRVRVWDESDRVSAWSEPSWFETALIDPVSEFSGEWIGRALATVQETPEPLLRKTFTAPKEIAKARLYIAGLGYYKAYLNGDKVGDHELDPNFSNYASRVYYTTFDVTTMLRQGDNAIGIRLGRSLYAGKGAPIAGENHNWLVAPWNPLLNEPKVNMLLRLTFADGTEAEVVTDTSWLTADGPTTLQRSGNETYDARLEKPGWATTGFDATGWSPAVVVQPPGGGCGPVVLAVGGCPVVTPAKLQAQSNEPMKAVRTYQPVRVTEPVENTRVYEFPILTAGWSRIVMEGVAGTEVKVRYSEKLAPDGTAEPEALSDQQDTYILRGGQAETYEPSYSYKGYLYVQVSSTTTLPEIVSVTGVEISNALARTGSFDSSSSLLNSYHQAMVQTTLNNIKGIPTDTPTYEKAGWTADAHLFGTSAMRNFGAQAFYEKYSQDVVDSQLPTGDIPSIAPAPADLNLLLDPGWAAAVVLIPYDLYQTYGDIGVIERDYPAMSRWMSAMELSVTATGYIFQGPVAYGDWVTPTNGKVQSAQIHGTAYIYRAATVMSEMAQAIGRTNDAARWTRLADNMRTAYNQRFYDEAARGYLNNATDRTPSFPEHGTSEAGAYAQTSQVEALAWGLAKAPHVDPREIFDTLVADVKAKDNHLATGASGTKWILPVLTDGGQSELAYKVATNPTYPGWGFWFASGATTMWETWAEDARSRNHAFMGTVDDWLYTRVAGLKSTSPGFRDIEYKPYPGGGLTWASASQQTPLGTASSTWRRAPSGDFEMDVVVPVGSVGRVYYPSTTPQTLCEVGGVRRVAATDADRVTFLGVHGDRSVFEVQSGTYKFRSTASGPCAGQPPSTVPVNPTPTTPTSTSPTGTPPTSTPPTTPGARGSLTTRTRVRTARAIQVAGGRPVKLFFDVVSREASSGRAGRAIVLVDGKRRRAYPTAVEVKTTRRVLGRSLTIPRTLGVGMHHVQVRFRSTDKSVYRPSVSRKITLTVIRHRR